MSNKEEYAKTVDENLFHVRNIFSGVDYDPLEVMNIKTFRSILEENNVDCPES